MKEMGQMAYEAFHQLDGWEHSVCKDDWARVESAIRADERSKTVEECARVVDRWPDEYPGIAKNSPEYFASLDRDIAITAAIRALTEKKDG